ncbi:MAG: inorganic diphosphatase [Methylobacteriaceae bacterium]|nr:inorganic diphosphatase [Methylobacteriaceae bacterium]
MLSAAIASLATYDDDSGDLLSVIETPKGSRNKYAYNDDLGAFQLKSVLPRGMLFPYDFGFIPSTRGQDGDPLDILVLLDEPTPMGCTITARVIGGIEAEQREKGGRWERNDRLIAVATHAHLHGNTKSVKDLDPSVINEIEAFFSHYNELENKQFRPLRCCGPKAAQRLIEEGIQKHSSDH